MSGCTVCDGMAKIARSDARGLLDAALSLANCGDHIEALRQADLAVNRLQLASDIDVLSSRRLCGHPTGGMQ